MSEKKTEKESGTWKDYAVYIFFGALIFAVLIFTYTLLIDRCYEDRGTFGDMFGGANALFSGMAFLGIIISIRLQSKELRATKHELAKSAEAQEASQKALAEQVKNMKLTAQLNALQIMLNHAYDRRDNPGIQDIASPLSFRQEIDQYKDRIEKILKELSQ